MQPSTNSYMSVYNTDALSKNLQSRCVAEPETCTETPGNCTKLPVQIYIGADTMGQENKIQSRHISTDTWCLLRSDKKNSHTLVHLCQNKNTEQMSGGRSATITITMTLTTTTMAGNVAGAAAGEWGGCAGAAAEAASALNLENGDDNGVVVD